MIVRVGDEPRFDPRYLVGNVLVHNDKDISISLREFNNSIDR